MSTTDKSLLWLYFWRFSTERIVATALGLDYNKNRNTLARLSNRGLTKRTESSRSSSKFIYLLTKEGVDYCKKCYDMELNYDTDISHMRQGGVIHTLACQLVTARSADLIESYEPERLLKAAFTTGKHPDIKWIVNGKNIAVEVELDGKSGWDLHMMLVRIVESIEGGDFYGYLIFYTCPETLARYKSALSRQIPRWERHGASGQPVQIGFVKARPEVLSRITHIYVKNLIKEV
ncbi:hypothetical protein SCD_n03041 (plasmid) [Sulfuricella denitrificans skB26]|uniref:Uncharacterized protein n=1 Tax=Sulfuricella denitrificans (strain DSM 22764 / NBRC 105220 / skB26) TaxID=1163617 RepID=S6ABK9_SULDS|nr:hypothetical protein [Sulfuricella denitrificans]BAN36840.1 hypothetical protein SCD_n03041 [Sulfuricella denitrificans skB26]